MIFKNRKGYWYNSSRKARVNSMGGGCIKGTWENGLYNIHNIGITADVPREERRRARSRCALRDVARLIYYLRSLHTLQRLFFPSLSISQLDAARAPRQTRPSAPFNLVFVSLKTSGVIWFGRTTPMQCYGCISATVISQHYKTLHLTFN